MKVTDKGVFSRKYSPDSEMPPIASLHPVSGVNIEDRELWLAYIQHVKSRMVGSSNYTTDYQEVYNLIFHVNAGKGSGKSYKGNEDYFKVIRIEIYTWYRPKETIRKEVYEGLKDFPIIYMEEVLDAFEQRNYYRNAEFILIFNEGEVGTSAGTM